MYSQKAQLSHEKELILLLASLHGMSLAPCSNKIFTMAVRPSWACQARGENPSLEIVSMNLNTPEKK